jgi:branched-chain amino acid transport system substrate-binding protein
MERIITPDGLPFPGKGSEATVEAYKKFSGQPWMDSEAASAYSNVQILSQAIEQAKSSKPQDIATALHKLHLVDFKPLAGMFPGWDDVSFLANGQRKGGSFVLTEWLDGVPKNVYPPDLAVAEADLGK